MFLCTYILDDTKIRYTHAFVITKSTLRLTFEGRAVSAITLLFVREVRSCSLWRYTDIITETRSINYDSERSSASMAGYVNAILGIDGRHEGRDETSGCTKRTSFCRIRLTLIKTTKYCEFVTSTRLVNIMIKVDDSVWKKDCAMCC